MKNREKYPHIDEALKAFKEHNEVCDCGCSFEEWLEKDDPSPVNAAITGILLGSLLGGIVGSKGKPADKDNEKPSNDDRINDVECPICHGKHGVIDAFLVPSFKCPDCGAYIGAKAKSLSILSLDGFNSFIADLCKKNNRKD